MAHTKVSNSSWISGITYAKGFFAIWTVEGSVLLYRDVPAYKKGLVLAGSVGKGKGRSIGRAYTHYIKGEANYGPCQTLKTEEAKERLKELFAELEIAIKRERKDKKREKDMKKKSAFLFHPELPEIIYMDIIKKENMTTVEYTLMQNGCGYCGPRVDYFHDLNKLYLDTRY